MSRVYLPIEFWSSVISALDSKIEALCDRGGYGEVKLTMKVHRGQVADIYFSDEIRARGILEQLKVKEEPREENKEKEEK